MARSAKPKKDKEDNAPARKPSSRKRKGEAASTKDDPPVTPEEKDEPKGGQRKGKKGTEAEEEEGFPEVKARSEGNILKCLDLLQYGPRRSRSLYLKTIGDACVQKSIKHLKAADYAGQFTRRITALTWHEKYPYALASASKFGDIMFVSGIPNDPELAAHGHPIKFETKAEIAGGGAGSSVTAMKFHERELNLLYRVGIDCIVARVDLARGETTQFHDTGDYNRWFCAMDLNFRNNMLVAADNKGLVYNFSLDGKLIKTWRLHANKIHHCEFSKKDPNVLVTASLDKTDAVKIWDVRYLKESKSSSFRPLHALNHSSGLNIAKFSPVDGSRLLTSDQQDEIRIYQGPLWKDYLTIQHHHKQFQHITPIKADWHPVNDYIVIGRYPKNPKMYPSAKPQPRAIELFDSYTGDLVDVIFPPLDEICSLNVFNPTGEHLATGMNSKLILWKPGYSLEACPSSKLPGDPSSKIPLSEATRNILRGRRAREYSPGGSDDEDNEDDSRPKKKRSKTTTSTALKTDTKNSTTSSRVSKKKK